MKMECMPCGGLVLAAEVGEEGADDDDELLLLLTL